MNPFFITSIPRSRTAWLANFLTTDSSFCFHDAMKDGWTANFVSDQLCRFGDKYKYIGDSDSGLTLVTSDLIKLFPSARWLFIDNEPSRAAISYKKWFTDGNDYPGVSPNADIQQIMVRAKERYDAAKQLLPINKKMVIQVKDLDDKSAVKAAWNWLVPTIPWNNERWDALNTFVVNIHPKKVTVKL